jgi:hypothetical protein
MDKLNAVDDAQVVIKLASFMVGRNLPGQIGAPVAF